MIDPTLAQIQRWLDQKQTTLWGRAFDLKSERTDVPAEWFAAQLDEFRAFATFERDKWFDGLSLIQATTANEAGLLTPLERVALRARILRAVRESGVEIDLTE